MSEKSINDKSLQIRQETNKYGNTRGRVADVIDDINETKANKADIPDVSDIEDHLSDFDNPHRVSKNQVGLGRVDNTSDKEKPLSYVAVQALASKADVAKLDQHIRDYGNPHRVTKGDVGLSRVDNTADVEKPISQAVQAGLDRKVDKSALGQPGGVATLGTDGKITASQLPAISSGGKVSSVNGKTGDVVLGKSDLGLSSVDNTSDADKPVSKATQEALNSKASKSSVDNHISDYSNPHRVSKQQVGLGNVDNTSDADKPISEAVSKALKTKIDTAREGKPDGIATLGTDGKVKPEQLPIGINAQGKVTSVNGKIGDVRIDKSDIGLGNVDNTSDSQKPISIAQKAELDTKAGKAALDAHIGDFSNPHRVTKGQIGLGAVNNTSDEDKPLSRQAREAINSKLDKSTAGVAGGLATLGADGKVPYHQLPNITSSGGAVQSVNGKTGIVHLAKADLGLGSVDNTSDYDKPISRAQAEVNKKLYDADAAILGRLETEENNRKNADSALQAGLNTVNAELGKEVAARKDADAKLAADISRKLDKPVQNLESPNDIFQYLILADKDGNTRRVIAELFRNNAVKYLGMIKPSTVIPAGQVWGFAGEGTYPNASNIVVPANSFALLTFDGSAWNAVIVNIGNLIVSHKADRDAGNLDDFDVEAWLRRLDVMTTEEVLEMISNIEVGGGGTSQGIRSIDSLWEDDGSLILDYTDQNGNEQYVSWSIQGVRYIESIYLTDNTIGIEYHDYDGIVTKEFGIDGFWDGLADTFVHREELKTINGQSLIGNGNLEINGFKEHRHEIKDIDNLPIILSRKSDINHTHEAYDLILKSFLKGDEVSQVTETGWNYGYVKADGTIFPDEGYFDTPVNKWKDFDGRGVKGISFKGYRPVSGDIEAYVTALGITEDGTAEPLIYGYDWSSQNVREDVSTFDKEYKTIRVGWSNFEQAKDQYPLVKFFFGNPNSDAIKNYIDQIRGIRQSVVVQSALNTDVGANGVHQNECQVKVKSGKDVVITLSKDAEENFIATYIKIGQGNVRFEAGSGVSIAMAGGDAVSGKQGSTANVYRDEDTYFVTINNY
ncbi:hypothetical protein SAMN05443429_11221 [Cruoricaptor ignavus]|uniref:Uncharacterized protein n=1 Tax=Cruoricaptor ignavus TaxID=1118202 RepID=A0A1M6HD56_9FLAO|nr:hypothetical protein [Cruoricaptor ignavus]SHJ20142.1 hypothetical protein SAMN05443429_11221 [Cruoricaptor ignavus]